MRMDKTTGRPIKSCEECGDDFIEWSPTDFCPKCNKVKKNKRRLVSWRSSRACQRPGCGRATGGQVLCIQCSIELSTKFKNILEHIKTIDSLDKEEFILLVKSTL